MLYCMYINGCINNFFIITYYSIRENTTNNISCCNELVGT